MPRPSVHNKPGLVTKVAVTWSINIAMHAINFKTNVLIYYLAFLLQKQTRKSLRVRILLVFFLCIYLQTLSLTSHLIAVEILIVRRNLINHTCTRNQLDDAVCNRLDKLMVL